MLLRAPRFMRSRLAAAAIHSVSSPLRRPRPPPAAYGPVTLSSSLLSSPEPLTLHVVLLPALTAGCRIAPLVVLLGGRGGLPAALLLHTSAAAAACCCSCRDTCPGCSSRCQKRYPEGCCMAEHQLLVVKTLLGALCGSALPPAGSSCCCCCCRSARLLCLLAPRSDRTRPSPLPSKKPGVWPGQLRTGVAAAACCCRPPASHPGAPCPSENGRVEVGEQQSCLR